MCPDKFRVLKSFGGTTVDACAPGAFFDPWNVYRVGHVDAVRTRYVQGWVTGTIVFSFF